MPIQGKITLGIELEAVRLTPEAVQIIQNRGFARHYDASIRDRFGNQLPRSIGEGGGSEVVTGIMEIQVTMDNEGKRVRLDYGNVREVINDLCACAAEVNTSCGVHLHLGNPDGSGRSVWKPDQIRTWLAVCVLREDKIFQLVPPSRRNNAHCLPIKARFNDSDLQSYHPLGSVQPRKDENPKRYCWLNLIETGRKGTDPRPGRMASEATGTVEIRLLGSTRRADYIWAWVQLWAKIAAVIAHLRSTFAFSACCITESLETEFQAVNAARLRTPSPEESSTVAPNNAPFINRRHPATPAAPVAPEVAPPVPAPLAPPVPAPPRPHPVLRRLRRSGPRPRLGISELYSMPSAGNSNHVNTPQPQETP